MTRPTGIQTNGEGRASGLHLNLTRSLADEWGIEIAKRELPMVWTPTTPSKIAAPKPRRSRRPLTSHAGRIPFAGYDPTERRLGVSGGSWA